MQNQVTNQPSESLTSQTIWAGLGAVAIGIFLSAIAIPGLVPGMIFSLTGEEPKVFWLLSRATAIFSFLLLWVSLAFGLVLTGKIAKYFPGTFTANDLHQFVSISGLVFGLLHGLLLTGDRYMQISLLQVFVPFTVNSYKPGWVGLGQLSLILWAILILSFYVRKWISYKVWRVIHFVGYLVFGGSLAHGILAGSDSGSVVMQAIYWVSAACILFLTFYRILSIAEAKKPVQPIVEKRNPDQSYI
jgi:predicted ferric reductase